MDCVFWRGEMGSRGKEEAPMVSVKTWDGRAGGAAGRTVRRRVPEDRGRGLDSGVGRWKAETEGISMRVVILWDGCELYRFYRG
jgi:hypothetical protein